jgi:3-hydroxyacyl-[acyl-carrier-protein] dehydratase
MPTLTNDIFSIISLEHSDGLITTLLGVNKSSEIFKGHFPGQPVVPGACMLQVVKDILENALAHTVRLKKGGQLKFMNMIVPGNEQLLLNISHKNMDADIVVSTTLKNGDVLCFKFQGSFVKV